MSGNRTRTAGALTAVLAFLITALGACSREPMQLTVVSYNVRHSELDSGENRWTARREKSLSVLTQMNADIIALQEASERQRGDLDELGLRCIECDTTGFSNHNAVLYNDEALTVIRSGTFWLSDTPTVVESTSWGNELPRWVTWAELRPRRGAPFLLYNTHLDHQSQESRLRALEAILTHAADQGEQIPMVLTGDFNAMQDWPELELMTTPDSAWPNLPLTDVLARENTDEDTAGTYHGYDDTAEPDRIDYILISKGILWHDAATVDSSSDSETPISDHFPIRATISVPETRSGN